MRTGITVSRRRGTRELAITAEIESALSQRETGGSNPAPSSGESGENQSGAATLTRSRARSADRARRAAGVSARAAFLRSIGRLMPLVKFCSRRGPAARYSRLAGQRTRRCGPCTERNYRNPASSGTWMSMMATMSAYRAYLQRSQIPDIRAMRAQKSMSRRLFPEIRRATASAPVSKRKPIGGRPFTETGTK